MTPGDEYIETEIKVVAASLTLDQKASQVLMTGIDGKERFPRYLYGHFRDTVPGAILLFGTNVSGSPEGVAAFLRDCDRAFEALDSPVPVIYAIDHEGGDVFRTKAVTSRLPSAADVARRLTPSRAERLYELAGTQLAFLGIKLNLAPVVEALTEENAAFLGTRSFSDSEATVVAFSSSAVRGFRKAGVATALKHFPGNGEGDPHFGLPVLDASKAELEEKFVGPFRKTLKSNPDAVLVSHVVVASIDPDVPFCLSPAGVTGVLRKELGFDGLVITDDIAMSALSRNGYDLEHAAVLALGAGCDMIMTSAPDVRSVSRAISKEAAANPAFMRRLDEAVLRVLTVKARTGVMRTRMEMYARSRMRAVDALRMASVSESGKYLRAKSESGKILEEMYGQ